MHMAGEMEELEETQVADHHPMVIVLSGVVGWVVVVGGEEVQYRLAW